MHLVPGPFSRTFVIDTDLLLPMRAQRVLIKDIIARAEFERVKKERERSKNIVKEDKENI